MYIGPWQEFALGRALQQRPDRRTASLRARPDAADRAADDAFAVDLEFFKAFASQSDEEGIRNLLRCAPRFVPIMQSLGRASQTRTAPHTTPHTAAVATAEPPRNCVYTAPFGVGRLRIFLVSEPGSAI